MAIRLWFFLQVESGFSIQKNQIVENLHEETMIAKRRVYDAIQDESIEKIVTDDMIKATHGSNSRYNAALEEKRKASSNETTEETLRKRKINALNVVREEERQAQAALEDARKKRKAIEVGKFWTCFEIVFKIVLYCFEIHPECLDDVSFL